MGLFLVLSSVFGLACGAEPPAAGLPRQAPQQATAAGLCLELHAPQESVQLGEPISVVASLLNCSSTTQRVQDLLSPEYGFLQVWIQPPDGKELLHQTVIKRGGRGKPFVALAPGERLSAFVPVYFSPEGWTIRNPGRYGVRAQYSADAAKFEAKSIYFTVRAPRPGAEQQAADLMMTREVGLFLAGGSDGYGEGSRRLRTLTEKYGETRLAPYARLALAISASQDRFDPRSKSFVKDGCEQATDQLALAVPRVGDPMLAATGTASWVRCLRQLGRDSEVNGAVSMFLRSHPHAKNVRGIEQLTGPTRKD